MDRRTCLASSACILWPLAGCLDLNKNSTNSIQVERYKLSTIDAYCEGSANHEASVSVSDTEVSVDGTFVTTEECPDLNLSLKVGRDPQSEGHLDIEIEEVKLSEENCSSCKQHIDYTVTVETDDHPVQVNVQHIPLEGKVKQPALWTESNSKN